MPADRRTRSSSVFTPTPERPARAPYSHTSSRASRASSVPESVSSRASSVVPDVDAGAALRAVDDSPVQVPVVPVDTAPSLGSVTPPGLSMASARTGLAPRAKAMASINQVQELKSVRVALTDVLNCIPAPDVGLSARMDLLENSFESHKKATRRDLESFKKTIKLELAAHKKSVDKQFEEQKKTTNKQFEEQKKATNKQFEELKAMIRSVTESISSLRAELKAEIAGVKTELKAEIAGVKTELKAEIAGVKADIAEVKADLAKLDERVTEEVKGLKSHASATALNARARSQNLNNVITLRDRLEPLLSVRTGLMIENFPATAEELLSLSDDAKVDLCSELNSSGNYFSAEYLVGIPAGLAATV